jgi:hypothetical protein
MKFFVRALMSVLVLTLPSKYASGQQLCDSPAVIALLANHVRELGFKSPDWLVRVRLQVPYFRMKDVEISAVSVRTKGPARTGLDCEADLQLTPPADMRATTKGVVIRIGYIIMTTPNGFDLDLY